MGVNLVEMPDKLLKARTHSIFDDFYHFVTGDDFTTVASDSGTVADSDAAGGVVILTPSDGTVANNDETYIKSTQEVFKFANNKPLVAEARLQFTEGNTDDVNIFFGVKDAIAADTLLDNGGGMAASFSGACIYKVDGGTVWKCITSISTTQTISTSTATAGGSSYQKLRIEFTPVSSTQGRVAFFLDDAPLLDATTGKEIVHVFTYTNATEMNVGAGIKNGADTTDEALRIDYIAADQLR